MAVDLTWSWLGVTVLAVGIVTGVWWALADFILDRVGPAPARWGAQDRPRADGGAHIENAYRGW